jgi:hypothetical protein
MARLRERPALFAAGAAILAMFAIAVLAYASARSAAEAARDTASSREGGADSSVAAVASVFDGAADLTRGLRGDAASEAPPPLVAQVSSSFARRTALEPEAVVPARAAIPVEHDVDVHRAPQPLSIATPQMRAGDRVLATVSFFYCSSVAGEASGDGGGFCGTMRDGSVVYAGAAACDVEYLGQRFRIEGDPTGRIYRCADTGSAVHGLHRDIWFPDNYSGWVWQLEVGYRVVIEIVE